MPTLRSVLSPAVFLVAGASALAAQGRIIDEGTLVITRPGAPAATESFRIREDNGVLLATGQLSAGTHRASSALRTDTLGTPIDYTLEVRDNGSPTVSVTAVARTGRLTARAQVPRGDESTREYPITPGTSLILDDDMLHQTYFLALNKRVGTVQLLKPHAARGGAATLSAKGFEPLTIGGRSVTATHYSLAGGGSAREFWLDARGRLLQVEVPGSGLKAVREELPR